MPLPPSAERTEEQQVVLNEVVFQYDRSLEDFFDRLHRKAQRQGWPTGTVEQAVEHHCGPEVLDQWERWRA